MTARSYDAVVLAGGTSRRMGGATDKTAISLAGRPMLDYVLDAVAGAERIVVVGEPRPAALPVQWCREQPPGGGPAAAIAAALPLVTADLVAVVAGDQPLLSADVVAEVVGAVVSDGAVGVDADGRPQWLLGAWRTSALRRTALVSGASLRDTLGSLAWAGVVLGADVTPDCDTPDDVRRTAAVLSERSLRA